MLPPAGMLATKNQSACFSIFTVLGILLALCSACNPPGAEALLKGDKLLREGRLAQAIQKLKRATELLPQNPHAWNHLGLAYHIADRPKLALQAYKQSLATDKNNEITITHYNLGCLYLEHNNSSAAIEELSTFCLLTNSLAGWLKLGSAYLRGRQFDAADRSYQAALKLAPRSAPALNGRGVVLVQRNKTREALESFNAALAADRGYAPATYNLALFHHQTPGMRVAALQKYREYLRLKPNGPKSPAIRTLVQQLENELSGRSQAILSGTLHRGEATPITNELALAAPSRATQRMPSTPLVVPQATQRTEFAFNVPLTDINLAPILESKPPSNSIEVVGRSSKPGITTNVNTLILTDLPPLVARSNSKTNKAGILSRLNPFPPKPKPGPRVPQPRELYVAEPRTPPRPLDSEAGRISSPFPRYRSQLTGRPALGDRRLADIYYQQGIRAQQDNRLADALNAYQAAVWADPSHYSAQYAFGLVAYRSKDWRRALLAYETARAINPHSSDAHFNFGLALAQAGYVLDATEELEKLVQGKTRDAPAHLTLANIYAQQLGNMKAAGRHYLVFLELEPSHPQAPQVRHWLAENH